MNLFKLIWCRKFYNPENELWKEEYYKYPYTGGLSNFAFNEPIKKELESFCLINNKPNWTMNQIIDKKEIIPNFKAVIEYEKAESAKYKRVRGNDYSNTFNDLEGHLKQGQTIAETTCALRKEG